ncbi:hypothetical protein N9934_01210 [Desulfosarcina sp.]|nr:hypothetical protein [Desulfosarcina sp.]
MGYRYVEFLPPAGKFIFVTFFIIAVDENCKKSKQSQRDGLWKKVFSRLNTKFWRADMGIAVSYDLSNEKGSPRSGMDYRGSRGVGGMEVYGIFIPNV